MALNLLAIDVSSCGWDVPEALGVVDWSVVDGLTIGDVGVDEAKGVEALFATLLRGQVSCEQLRILGTADNC